jgi:uncharacterized membrane protein YfcA
VPELNVMTWFVLAAAVLAVAFLYSSVGHGGATGYLAALALAGVAPASARVCALTTNVLVAGVAWWRFRQAGHFDARLLWSLAAASVPAAWLGSQVSISREFYGLVLGLVLVAAGSLLALDPGRCAGGQTARALPWPAAVGIGAALGFLAGLTGIGGGVFLSPLLLFFRWALPKTTGGIAAGFIVLNSIAGLIGTGRPALTAAGPLLFLSLLAVLAALAGTWCGARRWTNLTFGRVLALVLVFAGGKLLWGAFF